MNATRTVVLADLLSGPEAAQLAGISFPHLRVLLGQEKFPPPIRAKPNLWLREDVEAWKTTRH